PALDRVGGTFSDLALDVFQQLQIALPFRHVRQLPSPFLAPLFFHFLAQRSAGRLRVVANPEIPPGGIDDGYDIMHFLLIADDPRSDSAGKAEQRDNRTEPSALEGPTSKEVPEQPRDRERQGRRAGERKGRKRDAVQQARQRTALLTGANAERQ